MYVIFKCTESCQVNEIDDVSYHINLIEYTYVPLQFSSMHKRSPNSEHLLLHTEYFFQILRIQVIQRTRSATEHARDKLK